MRVSIMQKLIQKFTLTFFLFLSTTGILARTTWTSGKFQVALEGQNLVIRVDGQLLMDISSIQFNFASPLTITMDSISTEKCVVNVIYPSVVDYGRERGEQSAQIQITPVKNGLHFFSQPGWANHTTIQLIDQDEHYFGLVEMLYPDNQKSPDLRGTVVDVEAEANGSRYHENYASIWSAFYISSRGYASFFDTFAKGKYWLGIDGKTKLYHATGRLDWYLFYGPEGRKIHEAYFDVIGKPKYVPIWACGPVIWRDDNKGGAPEILADIEKFTEMKIPVTAWWVDRPYSDGNHQWSKMNFNEKFKNPGEWIGTLNKKYNIQFLTWVGPCTFGDKDFPGLLPGFFGYLDLSNPEAVKEYEKRLVENQYAYGVRGHKNDRGEEHFPVSEPWYDRTPEPQRRNKYLYLYAKVQHEIAQKALGKDHFLFARAAFHRTQPYLNGVWGGDVRNTWDGLSANLANAMRCGFMGFPVWGTDCGGYLGQGRIDELLYTRWIQWGAWNGLFEVKIDGAGGSGEDRPPWKYSKQFQNIFRQVCQQRLEMIPYIYSLANTAYKNGVLMKPLLYEFPTDPHTYEIWDEYIFGDAFLVAPLYDSTNTRDIYFPEGIWYSADLKGEIKGNQTLSMTFAPSEFPIFIRKNSLYITGLIYSGNAQLWIKNFEKKRNLIIHAFPGSPGEKKEFTYVDYLDGDREKVIQLTRNESNIILDAPSLTLNGIIKLKSGYKPHSVLLNGKKTKFKYDRHTGVVSVKFNGNEKIHLVVE